VDTRTKILTAAAARQIAPPVAMATGFFDVLRAEHIRELGAIKHGGVLLVVVLPLAEELLGQRSRAELVAGLRMVDYVVAADHGDVDALIDALKPVRLARLEVADERRARQLMDHVQRRQIP
jgi:bifunctional ADP-heptose synthase (sugar kinase/adenylyltransferase)